MDENFLSKSVFCFKKCCSILQQDFLLKIGKILPLLIPEGILQHLTDFPISIFFLPVKTQVLTDHASPVWQTKSQIINKNRLIRFETCILRNCKITKFKSRFYILRILVLNVFLLLINFSSFSQERYRYLILFKDKSNSGYSLDKPEEFLSKKSLLRREKNQVQLNEQDLPVNPTYLKEINALGAKIVYPLKWINGALIQMTPSLKNKVLSNQHVKGLYYPFAIDSSVTNTGNSIHKGALFYAKETTEILYGSSNTQIVQIGIDHMHKAGITGNEVLITLLDDGFTNTTSLPTFKKLMEDNRIIATMATSPDRKSVFEKGTHGTNVLSVISGYTDNNMIGGAYKAKIALAQTEESEWEKLVEEVNWIRGAEWADSLGTDIISSSLGYSQFDLPLYNHQYNQLNGNTTLVTKAANWASDRGITCVISAGNEGSSAWKYITAPADAIDILSVGAVSSSSIKIGFSSLGPSSDGRLKPDVCALGSGVRAADTDGSFGYFSGTSFSAPLVCSLVAGLMEQFPKQKASSIRDIIRKSSTLASAPNNFLGYGVPSYEKAVELISPVLETKLPKEHTISIYPNPVEIGGNLHLSAGETMDYEVEILSIHGQIIQQFHWKGEEKNISLGPIQPGKYFFRIKSAYLPQIIPIIVY